MKKRLFLITLSIFIISSVFCAPSKRMVLDYIQSNGYILKIKIIGDEKVQRYFTIDNISISKDADNNFYYTEIYENQLICGDIIAKNPEDRNSDESEFVNELQNDYNEFITTYLTNQNYSSISRSAAVADSKQTFTGLHKYPVILVQFSDVKFSSENPQEIFNNFFNEEGYSHEGATGSVKDYFTEQSSGKYVPQFDVLGPITLNKDRKSVV